MMWMIVVGALFVGAKYSLLAAGLVWLVGYAASCWWFPYVDCLCCKGKGKHRSKKGKTFRRCKVCSGKGSWFRFGRVVWHAVAGSGRRR